MNAPTRYPPQKGVWTLIAPDGRKWEGNSGLEVAGLEQRERIPASVALERIYRALDDETSSQETRAHPAGSCLIGGDCDHMRQPDAIEKQALYGNMRELYRRDPETRAVPTVTTIEKCDNCGVLTNDPRHVCKQV